MLFRSLPDRFFRQRYAGDISQRQLLNREVAEFIAQRLLPLLNGGLLLVLYLLLTLAYSPRLGLVVLVTPSAPLFFAYSRCPTSGLFQSRSLTSGHPEAKLISPDHSLPAGGHRTRRAGDLANSGSSVSLHKGSLQ